MSSYVPSSSVGATAGGEIFVQALKQAAIRA